MEREQFFDEIDEIVLEQVREYPDFYRLMKLRKGIHPVDIKNSVKRLYRKKKISGACYKKIMKSARERGKNAKESGNCLPVPHLLDYDWRFSANGIKVLCALIKKNCDHRNSVIAFVGTPSLFKAFFSKRIHENQYILIDKNADKHIRYMERYTHNFSFIKQDIMNPQSVNIEADLVIMDPPWYLNYNKLFFRFAAHLVKPGGKIICVMPPKYTRKNIDEEIQNLKEYMVKLGLNTVNYYNNKVTYNTPPFERNVLKENGIFCMPPNWRTGDILICRKTEIEDSTSPIKISEDKWEEIDFGIVRYKIKLKSDLQIRTFDLTIERPYKNDIYPSVKRSRVKGEEKINIWTSGNRVFYCKNISLLYYILLKLSVCYPCISSAICADVEDDFNIKLSEVQKKGIQRAIELIKEINAIESKEYGTWGSEL